jgi:hypothetical protein
MAIDWKQAAWDVRRAFEEAEVKLDPFPHLIASPVFPRAIYDELMERWPKQDAGYKTTNWKSRLEYKWADLERTLEGEALEFWRGVNALCMVANNGIRNALGPHMGVKFSPYLGDGWEAACGEIEYLDTKFQMAVYTGQHDLPPHVDNLLLVTNAFVYCSEKDEPEPDLGTVMFRAKGLMIPTNWTLTGPMLKPFLERVGTAPYTANSCFAYINGPSSFHAVDPHDIGARERRLLMFGSRMYVREAIRIFGKEIGELTLPRR